MDGKDCASVLASSAMTAPRMILPDRFYIVTRRCSQRMFLLRPDPEANRRFLYCLIEAANRWGITVVLPSMMSNHHHTIIYDREGHVVEFVQHFHSMLARSMNALRGRWENFFSTEEPSLVELVDRNDILDKLTYAAANPVKDGLVERVTDWPGVNGLEALLSGRLVKVGRPEKFFRDTGEMPEHVEHMFQVPKDTQRIGDVEQFLNELRESVARTEAEFAQKRAEEGRCVLGRRGVLRQSWRDSPTSQEPRRGLRPRVAARSEWSRRQALQRNRVFIEAYRAARKLWLAGKAAIFPRGTFWLRRFAHVQVAGATLAPIVSN
jgi:REP element-mobilizing transposase RayT